MSDAEAQRMKESLTSAWEPKAVQMALPFQEMVKVLSQCQPTKEALQEKLGTQLLRDPWNRGLLLELWWISDNLPERQRWTVDPQTGILTSADPTESFPLGRRGYRPGWRAINPLVAWMNAWQHARRDPTRQVEASLLLLPQELVFMIPQGDRTSQFLLVLDRTRLIHFWTILLKSHFLEDPRLSGLSLAPRGGPPLWQLTKDTIGFSPEDRRLHLPLDFQPGATSKRLHPPPTDPRSPEIQGGPFQHIWSLQLFLNPSALQVAIHRGQLLQGGLVLSLLAGLSLIFWRLFRLMTQEKALREQQFSLIANVSHELLTPVAGIVAAGQNLRDGLITEERRVRLYGEQIAKDGERLKRMMDQLLLFSRFEVAAAPLQREPLFLDQMFDELCQNLQDSGQLGSCHHKKNGGLSHPLLLDRDATTSILLNLLLNAVKYSGDDPTIRSFWEEKDGYVWFRLQNGGLGFSDDERHRVFQPFQRGKRHIASSLPGSGLGLSIARRLTELQGGQLELTHTKNPVEFTLKFPMETPS